MPTIGAVRKDKHYGQSKLNAPFLHPAWLFCPDGILIPADFPSFVSDSPCNRHDYGTRDTQML